MLAIQVRDPATRKFRYGAEAIAPHLQVLLVRLFTLIETRGDNEYIIKCVLRVLAISKHNVGPVVPSILQKLSAILERVLANPANPLFNHNLFDCIAATIKFGSQAGVSLDLLEQVRLVYFLIFQLALEYL